MKSKLKALLRFLRWVLLVAAVAGAIGYVWWRQSPYSSHDFDHQAWHQGVEGEELGVVRGRMADDLIENRGLVGKPRGEIVELLGDPDAESLGPLLEWHLAWSSLFVRLDRDGNATAIFERMW